MTDMTDRVDTWKQYHSPRESTGSSTLYMNSIDGDGCCSSSSTSRNSCNLQDQPLWKRRAASISRASRNRQRSNMSRNSSTADISKEIRINIIKPELDDISAVTSM